MRLIINILAMIAMIISLTGCGPKNPATLNKSEVEALLKIKLELKEMSLEAKPEGGFTGTGKGNDGSPFKINVIQDKKESQLSYTAESASGDEIKGYIKNN